MDQSTMRTTAGDIKTAPSPAGIILRQWRNIRGKTQLGLSFDAGISQKHISFVESGRSIPSRQTLLDLAQALDVPLRERNELLTAAGYAALYPNPALDAPVMNSINKALQRMLRQHEPFPAIVLDRHWNVLMTNDAAPQLFNCFVDLAARPNPRNLLHLMFDPNGMRPFVANWSETARGLLGRVYREALGHVIDEKTKALLAELSQYPGVKSEWRTPSPGDVLPMIPFTFVKGGVTLKYFSMITTVGTPQTVTAEELRLECMFPADDLTESGHGRFIAAHSAHRSARH
jgi:transcriptional regulator with XRE-family HTH domain